MYKMKKAVLFFAVLAATSVGASAQNMKFGVNIGTDLGWYSSSEPQFNSSDMKAGIVAGGSLSYEFGNHITLNSGLNVLYSNTNFSARSIFYTTDTEPKYKSVDVKTLSFEIPLTVGYNFKIGKSLSLQPNIGIYARYGVASFESDLTNRVAVTGSDGSTTFNEIADKWKPYDGYPYEANEPNDNLSKLKRWDVGATIGLKMTVNDHYTISADYKRGFSEQLKVVGLKNNGLRFTVGYTF